VLEGEGPQKRFELILNALGESFIIIYACLIILSSPFVCMFGDDSVTCYMGVDDVSSGVGDT